MGKNDSNRAGGTSQRCGNPPAVHFSTPFVPRVSAPEPLSLEDLDLRVKAAGFLGDNPEVVRHMLGQMSFQHASMYFQLFRDSEGKVRPGTSFSDVHRVILFDRKLQAILMEYIGLFELKFRAQYSYLLSAEGGAFAHRDPCNFKRRVFFDSFLRSYEAEFSRQLRAGNPAIKTAYNRYGDAPVWLAVETMSLGTLSKLYANTRSSAVRRGVADSFGTCVSDLTSWTKTLSFVRNRCAHFGPLAGQRLMSMPARISGVPCDNSGIFYVILVIEKLLNMTAPFALEDPSTCYGLMFLQEVIDLFNEFSDMLGVVGVPENWDDAVVMEEVIGLPCASKTGTEKDGPFWMTIVDEETGGTVKFSRWGGKVVRPGAVDGVASRSSVPSR